MKQQRRAVIIALHDLHRNSRVLKQATALHSAGFSVTAVGIIRRSTDEVDQRTEFGRVIRVRTTQRLHSERDATTLAAPGRDKLAPGRSVFAGIRMFLGRMRENRLMAKAATALCPDVVVASDLTAWAAGVRVKRRTGARLICDARDLVTDSGREWPASYVWLLRRLERWVAKRADAVLTVAPLMAGVLEERLRLNGGVPVIYNGPFECRTEVNETGSPLRVFFQGAFAPNRAIDVMIRAVASLDGQVVLGLQGFGALRQQLEDLVDELGARDVVRFIEPCAPYEVVESAAKHDVGLFWVNADTPNLRATVPIKVFDYIAAGLAVVSADLPGTRAIVDEAGCGVLLDPSDPSALATTLRWLANEPDAVMRMKKNALAACPQYSWETQGRRFLEIVDSVMGGSGG